MDLKVKVEGFRDLEQELLKLASPATRKAAARRALKKAAEPLAETMRAYAPERTGKLAQSITVSTRASGGDAGKKAFARVVQAGGSRADAVTALRDARRASASLVEMHVGPGRHPKAITQEFGTWFHPPQPFARPAFDVERDGMLDRIRRELAADIAKAVARAERKAARLATRG
jgi:HK97 gp10 family phage protein